MNAIGPFTRSMGHDFDGSPEHLADIAASYPGFGKASPERKALLDQRHHDREARARLPVGLLDSDPERSRRLSDEALLGLMMDHRKFARTHRGGGK